MSNSQDDLVAKEHNKNDFKDADLSPCDSADRDGFKFAPKKPDGDIWQVAVEPLMKRESEQCSAWKDEVQNLLIFAGLFSAVVTAFIIESYKTLHGDPQDTMVSLLSQILVRLENSTSPHGTSASNFSSSGAPAFIPDRSAERINSFWFISLILSLATALIGIISLQWLREYQSYADFSSEETLALFTMRKDGLERWQVPKVLTALPLLLQGALVLFLAGMVDFSLALGTKVGVPVIIAIALTLAFLLLTTVLPTFQTLLYLLRLPRTRGPRDLLPQCPYKSPQSRTFLIATFPFFAFVEKICRRLKGFLLRFQTFFNSHFNSRPEVGSSLSMAESTPYLLVDSIHNLLSQTTWSEYDRAWLQLRDDLSKEMFDEALKLGQERTVYFFHSSYTGRLADLLTGLRTIMESNVQETSLAAAYHCFRRVSDSLHDAVLKDMHPNDTLPYIYIATLLKKETEQPFVNFLDISGITDASTLSSYSTAFNYQSLAHFISIPSTPWREHYFELYILIKHWLYEDHRKLVNFMLEIPSLSAGTAYLFPRLDHCTDNLTVEAPVYLTYSSCLKPIAMKELTIQYGNIYIAFFNCISRGDQYRDWMTSIHVAMNVPEFLAEGSCLGYNNLLAPTSIAIAEIIVDYLQRFLDLSDRDDDGGGGSTYNLLFYAASIYLHSFPKSPPGRWGPRTRLVCEKMDEARIALLRYKAKVLDVFGPDIRIETLFEQKTRWTGFHGAPFSAEWWDFLEEPFLVLSPNAD